MMAEEFNVDVLCAQPWVQAGACVEVYSEPGDLLEARRVATGANTSTTSSENSESAPGAFR